MATKSQKEKPSYRQEAYQAYCLSEGDAMERLYEQWTALSQLQWPSTLDDHEALRKVAEEIDTDLIRYAISALRTHLQEAAIRDTGRLIAERVLDTTLKQTSLQRWESWLGAAPCWPTLAQDNWPEAVRQAAKIVVEALSEAGVQVDPQAEEALADQVGRLSIEDLLPKATIERLFPTSSETKEC